MIDPVVLALTAYAHNFFVVSPQDARRLAVRALEIADQGANEADLIDLMNLLWRANRDARRIEESDRHVPICLIVSDLPEEFVLDVEEVRPSRYAEHFERQPRGQEEYEGFPAPWRVVELQALRERQDAEHLASRHDHDHLHSQTMHPVEPEERQRQVERDLRSQYGE